MRTALLLLTIALPLVPVQQAAAIQSPAQAVRDSLADVLTLPPESRAYARYVSAYHLPAAAWPKVAQTLAFVTNSLSRHNLLVAPVQVRPSLWRIDLAAYRISPKAFDDLGRLGSGRTPFSEPYFHQVLDVESYEYRDQEYGYQQGGQWVTTRTVRERVAITKKQLTQAVWLPLAEALQLALEAQSDFPIYRADWFFYYATLEPRYHELLGLDDARASFLKLAAVDEKLADREGVQARGAVLTTSEVAEHNRSLERTPTILRHGRGYYWKSNDYATSIQGDDVLADLLNDKPAAQELIASLRNGLQFYFVVDDKGKRLDRAAINVARDKRTPLSSPEVEIRNCMTCHARGMVPFEDEVRLTARDKVALALRQLHEKDARQAERIQDRYFAADLGALIETDIASYEGTVRACNGLAAAANALQFQTFLVAYEQPVSLESLAPETGLPLAAVKGAIERSAGTTLDHSVVALANKQPRRARRDQIEAKGFSDLMTLYISAGGKP